MVMRANVNPRWSIAHSNAIRLRSFRLTERCRDSTGKSQSAKAGLVLAICARIRHVQKRRRPAFNSEGRADAG
jgi:hypothetical protein